MSKIILPKGSRIYSIDREFTYMEELITHMGIQSYLPVLCLILILLFMEISLSLAGAVSVLTKPDNWVHSESDTGLVLLASIFYFHWGFMPFSCECSTLNMSGDRVSLNAEKFIPSAPIQMNIENVLRKNQRNRNQVLYTKCSESVFC